MARYSLFVLKVKVMLDINQPIHSDVLPGISFAISVALVELGTLLSVIPVQS